MRKNRRTIIQKEEARNQKPRRLVLHVDNERIIAFYWTLNNPDFTAWFRKMLGISNSHSWFLAFLGLFLNASVGGSELTVNAHITARPTCFSLNLLSPLISCMNWINFPGSGAEFIVAEQFIDNEAYILACGLYQYASVYRYQKLAILNVGNRELLF